MYLILFLKGVLIGLIASVPLGPIGVLCVQRTLNKGRISGFFSGMGAAIADTFFAIVAVLGLTYIINFVEQQQFYIRLTGVFFLIFLGLRIFYTNPVLQMRKQRLNRSNLLEDFLSVFIITLTNPLAIFIFIAAFASFGLVADKGSYISPSFLVSGVLAGAASYWFLLSSMVNIFRKSFRLRRLWWINKIAGVIIVFFGLATFIFLFFT